MLGILRRGRRVIAIAAAVGAGAAITGIAFALFNGEADSSNTISAEGGHAIQIRNGTTDPAYGTSADGALTYEFSNTDVGTAVLVGQVDVRNNNLAGEGDVDFEFTLANVSAAVGQPNETLEDSIIVTIMRQDTFAASTACNAAPDDDPTPQTTVGSAALTAFSSTWISTPIVLTADPLQEAALCFYFELDTAVGVADGTFTYDLTFTAVDETP